jgi:hypothetical protein
MPYIPRVGVAIPEGLLKKGDADSLSTANLFEFSGSPRPTLEHLSEQRQPHWEVYSF